ncbi:MAG: GNAT family N-acetyltransferase [candidate division WOR-3 bacterium]|nr:MAG: GNAT family N-acetyltransferase [candidate division WOR-3 bacterium]
MNRGDIKIRDARRSDIDAIYQLWIESMKYHERFGPSIFGFDDEHAAVGKRFITDQSKKATTILIVAEKSGRIIGYLLGEIRDRLPFQKLKKTGYIFDIVVTEKERHKGIGSLLLQRSFAFFKKNNMNTVMLSVSEENIEAIKFYEKHSFTTYLRNMVRVKI